VGRKEGVDRRFVGRIVSQLLCLLPTKLSTVNDFEGPLGLHLQKACIVELSDGGGAPAIPLYVIITFALREPQADLLRMVFVLAVAILTTLAITIANPVGLAFVGWMVGTLHPF
jgi:hypothetical protein